MLNNERLAVAAHLHNLLRRKSGRVTDVAWMAQDDAYAREVVRLALAEADPPALLALAYRMQALLPPAQAPASGMASAPSLGHAPAPSQLPARYVRSLR